MSLNNFLIPWSKRDESTSEKVNFLWKDKNIYIMDNHRCALWCWGQELDQETNYNFLHLDAHYDASPSILGKVPDSFQLKNCSLEDFLNFKDQELNIQLFRWDNYLPLCDFFFNFRKKVAMTQKIGKSWNFHFEFGPEQLVRQANQLFVDELAWVINLDVDYFFARDYKKTPYIHPDFIESFFQILYQHYLAGDIAVITLALSPECCGGWKEAESILLVFEKVFNLKIQRPTN